MSTLSAQAQALLARYGQEAGVTPDQVANLQASINRSPPLVDQVNHQTHAYTPVAPSTARTPADPAHPDHAMLQQIRGHVGELERSQGREYNDTSERISRCLLAACKDQRDMYPQTRDEPLAGRELARVDHVVLGTDNKNIFAVEGRLDEPAHRRSVVNIEQAMRTPVEQSDQKLEAANQQIFGEKAQEQLLAQQRTRHGPGIPGQGQRM